MSTVNQLYPAKTSKLRYTDSR